MFLCCGDALYDLFASTTSDDEPGMVHLSGNAGGSPMNVAAGLARLGHGSRFLTKLSSDLFGVRIRGYLERNTINTELCIDTDLNTTLAIVEKQPDGSAKYVFYVDNTADVFLHEEELPASLPDDVRVVHFGSYSTAIGPVSSALQTLAKREDGRRIISYDPNLRTSIEPDIERWKSVFKAFAGSANIIKASDEDIEALLGTNKEDEFVANCFDHGAQLVFITRGADGSSAFKPDGRNEHCKGVAVNVVDTVGAGDTFQAATLHWLQAHRHIDESASIAGDVDIAACMAFAIRAAAITCTRAGADLPALADLE